MTAVKFIHDSGRLAETAATKQRYSVPTLLGVAGRDEKVSPIDVGSDGESAPPSSGECSALWLTVSDRLLVGAQVLANTGQCA